MMSGLLPAQAAPLPSRWKLGPRTWKEPGVAEFAICVLDKAQETVPIES
jgi:hypothetical protein